MGKSNPSTGDNHSRTHRMITFDSWSWERCEYISRSPRRIQILHFLQNNSDSKQKIAEHLDIPKSTLLRTLKEICDYGWISEVENGLYTITPLGVLILKEFKYFFNRFEALAGLAQLWQRLPSEITNTSLFSTENIKDMGYSDISISLASFNAPYTPVKQFAKKLRIADVNCVFMGVPNPFYYEPVSKLVIDDSVTKFIASRDVIDGICKQGHLDISSINNSTSILVTDEQFEFGIITTDDMCIMEGLDDQMKTQIVAEIPLRSDFITEWVSTIATILKEEYLASNLDI